MKKLFLFIAIFAVPTTFLLAQIKVPLNGNVGIKLPNTTSSPLSALSVGNVGYASALVTFDGSNGAYSSVLSVFNNYPSYSNAGMIYQTYGIYSEIRGATNISNPCYTTAIKGFSRNLSLGTGSYRGIGVHGSSDAQTYNIGVLGDISNAGFGSEFSPGIYLYALIADGTEIEVKRIILTE
ncbi:MAG: hypothetical protein FWH18_03470 [Marinilabiliaceae bacterium]|nr:hypothetical protein [Marinilabiliaceae bacterium]